MVCRHCIEAVKAACEAAGITGAQISLGYACVADSQLTAATLNALDKELETKGFQRISDHNEILVERIKQIIIEHVRTHTHNFNLSACLADRLATDYSSLSRIFSASEGRTIEKYAILQRIEYVKELLSYRELTISEIAYRAGYSSAAHLSRQFKEVTGMTPTAYLKTPTPRLPLNSL